MQTPNLVNGQIVKQAETDIIIAAIRSINQMVRDLLLAQLNAVISGGFALSAATGTPILVNYAQGVVILSGYDIAVPAGTLTISAADPTFHRYDLLTFAYSQTTPTDSAGQPTTVDTATPTVVKGTAGASPVLPALPAGSAQIGWIDVPPGVTSATQCTLHPTQGPLVPNNLQDLTTHIAASMATAVVHGFQATGPGGTDANRLAVTDSHGDVGAALNLGTGTGVYYPPTTPGGTGASAVAITDGSGRVGRAITADQLGGVAPAGYATLDGNGRVPDTELNRGHKWTAGRTSSAVVVPNNGSTNFDVALDDSSFTPTTGALTLFGGAPPGVNWSAAILSFGAGVAHCQAINLGSGATYTFAAFHVVAYL